MLRATYNAWYWLISSIRLGANYQLRPVKPSTSQFPDVVEKSNDDINEYMDVDLLTVPGPVLFDDPPTEKSPSKSSPVASGSGSGVAAGKKKADEAETKNWELLPQSSEGVCGGTWHVALNVTLIITFSYRHSPQLRPTSSSLFRSTAWTFNPTHQLEVFYLSYDSFYLSYLDLANSRSSYKYLRLCTCYLREIRTLKTVFRVTSKLSLFSVCVNCDSRHAFLTVTPGPFLIVPLHCYLRYA